MATTCESRQECLGHIEGKGKREFFKEVFIQKPEDFFESNKDMEPHIWMWVLDELKIR